MRAIRQSSDQFRNALAEMPMHSRVLFFVLVAAVIIGFSLLIRGNQTVETEYLFGGRTLGEQEIDSVEMTFSRAKLNGWQRDGRRIKIPTQNRSDYLSALDGSAALPMSLRSSVQEAIDKASLFEPTSQRLARQLHAKERDLGNKLTAFDEIRWASVEHDLGERNGLGARTQSASVVVCPEGDSPLAPARTELIREFIRGSYAGMRAEDVVVIDTNADPTVCPTNDPIARIQCEEEARLEQEVEDILQGYGPIRIAAYIEMEGSQSTTSMNQTPTLVRQPEIPPPVVIQSQPDRSLLNEIIEAVTHVSSNRATRLNQNTSPSRPAPKAQVSVNKVSPDKPALTSVRLSIGIPESYYQKVWQLAFQRDHRGQGIRQIPAINPTQLASLQERTKANITTAITPVLISRVRRLGFRGDQSATAIDVWNYPDLNAEPVAEPNHVATGINWLSHSWRPIAAGLLLGAVVWFLFGAFRSHGKRNLPAQQAVNSRHSENFRFDAANTEIDDEMTAVVDRHPDLAVDAFRDWITEAA